MKKQVYFGIIGVGALLAIIGFIPGGMSGIWGILIAGITAVLYFINTKNEKKVQERLSEEKGMFQKGGADASTDAGDESAAEETPATEEPADSSEDAE